MPVCLELELHLSGGLGLYAFVGQRWAGVSRAGQKVLTLQGAMPRETDFKQVQCADSNGLSLHAAVRCAADDRKALEQLFRYGPKAMG